MLLVTELVKKLIVLLSTSDLRSPKDFKVFLAENNARQLRGLYCAAGAVCCGLYG